jgi:hypothetical protein
LIKEVALSPAFRQRIKQPAPKDQFVAQEH